MLTLLKENHIGIAFFFFAYAFCTSLLFLNLDFVKTLYFRMKILLFLMVSYISIHLFAWPYLKRVAFSFFVLNLLIFFRRQISDVYHVAKQKDYNFRLVCRFVSIALLVKLVPGGYAPPFWGGIAGWKFKSEISKQVDLSGLKLVNFKGESQWYSNGFTVPQSFMYRQYLQFQNEPEELTVYLRYLVDLYQKSWGYTQNGLFLYQKYLGRWAAPGHMPGRMLDYSHFSPDDIRKIEYVSETWDKSSHTLKDKKVHFIYVIESNKVIFNP